MANDLALKAGRARRVADGLPGLVSGFGSGLLRDPWVRVLLALATLNAIWAATGTTPAAVQALWQWSPALLRGLGMNIQISVLAMALGTLLGLVVGALSLSPSRLVRRLMRAYVLLFRNAPILVLVYFTTYVFPFDINLAGWRLPFPDWIKVVIGLGLPASANVAEIFRGAIQSIPSAQWEAAQSLAFRRTQIFRMVVLPQCVRRMLPSWMNLLASITMSTSLASLVGVHDLVDTATVASNTVARSDFTILVYFTLLALFFAYCYPIARWTRYLERRHAHH
ncbi:MAG: amino acid ABC transporter permease [Achromobacter sp.]|uniref:ABC transporter, permease protein n=1 Tax=Achromobacter piechaudii ATCC 43553 TaxID=742159 RepID=D4XCS5_9BURK|nr:amino acid ABC transporter permease [Achromobacter piechaudii]EFF75461.1 ABC transporter, permease protein [Achromobacter piechaudii ATCC 43553]KNY10171.1 amino acid ABC transporter [Achromobacter piechaudii]MPS77842.1 amino acid ABC transporter permease [Achromobacter sp.]